jgi:hypothetical protein
MTPETNNTTASAATPTKKASILISPSSISESVLKVQREEQPHDPRFAHDPFHQHSGIGFHTPANVHYGHAKERSATGLRTRRVHDSRHRKPLPVGVLFRPRMPGRPSGIGACSMLATARDASWASAMM